MTVNGDVSFWFTPDAGGPGLPGGSGQSAASGGPALRPPLDGDRDADVAIVGAGFTGLWTAYYLAQARPDLSIVILEARFAGFGASGRNGGWLTNSITGGREAALAAYGRPLVGRWQTLMNESVDEVIDVAAVEGIDATIFKGGELTVGRNSAQRARLEAFARSEAAFPEAGVTLLSASETADRVRIDRPVAGLHHPHAAPIQPAVLVRGLADSVERRGVTIHEGTPVTRIEPHRVVTRTGSVRARHVIRATEGFTAALPGSRREWLPLNSSMIATERLPASFWAEVDWERRDVVADMAHVYMYAQRTADDRIALGGRGTPYRYGSRIDADGRTGARTVEALGRILRSLFPAADFARIDHAWSGVLGVPRDWRATVSLDPATGIGRAGGYVGTGVTTTNLAGRTLRDLVLRDLGDPSGDTELLRMPWVGHEAGLWEPEPLRWLGVTGIYAAYRAADAREAHGLTRTSLLARLADHVAGH